MPTTTTPPPNPAPVVSQSFMARMSGRFAVLNGAQRELWLVFAIKFLMVAAYGITNFTLKLWLSSDFGYSDKESLALVATWSLMYTVFTLLVGSLTDAIGLRRTFFIGVWVCILT